MSCRVSCTLPEISRLAVLFRLQPRPRTVPLSSSPSPARSTQLLLEALPGKHGRDFGSLMKVSPVMAVRCRKRREEIVRDDHEEVTSISKGSRRRWRIGFKAICCARVLVSLTRMVLVQNNQLWCRSLSYLVTNENPVSSSDPETQSYLEVDKTMTMEMVKGKSFESLSNLEGVKQVTQALNLINGSLETQSYLEVDKAMTTEMVREKNFECLTNLEGVKQEAQALNLINGSLEAQSYLEVDKTMTSEMVREKSFESLCNLGGVKLVAQALKSDPKTGVSDNEADLVQRRNVYGANKYAKQPLKSFRSYVFVALTDKTIILLLGCAVLALVSGVTQQGLKNGWYDGLKNGWYDGSSILLAVFLAVIVSAVSTFMQNRQFERLSNQSSDITVEVVRDKKQRPILVSDIVVGDIVCLKTGDQIPADGLFLEGHSLKVMTGESDHVEIDEKNPFLISGTEVIDGCGVMLVTSVGINRSSEKMMSSTRHELKEETPLQARLNQLTCYCVRIGSAVAVLVLVVMLIWCLAGSTRDEMASRKPLREKMKLDHVIKIVVGIVAVAGTIFVVAIPGGLPLAITLSLVLSVKRMMKNHSMVRKLSACEIMGSATTICTDKTGTLTLNQMKVVECWLGTEAIEGDNSLGSAPNIYSLLQEAVGLNMIGSVYRENSASASEISGSPTEKAILSWAEIDLGMKVDEPNQNCEIIHVEPFNSEKKRSGVTMRITGDKAVRTHWKGAAEIILAMCSQYYDRNGMIKVLADEERVKIGTIIKDMAEKSLRCIAFAHKITYEEVPEKLEETELALLVLVGLKDPCRPDVRRAVECCRKAGVKIMMITGDNVHTARAIAIDCGILNLDEDLGSEAVVEGIEFRNYTTEERMAKIESIQVMARSSPFDKLLMVQCLKQKGHVVAVTGGGTNDALALKEADIGLCMGIQGTAFAKESSDIVILDDHLSSVVTVLMCGRCIRYNIQRFIQFQLTVSVTTIVFDFVMAVSSGKVLLTTIQFQWVNLIMNTLGAFQLAIAEPTKDLMLKPPIGRSEPLITKIMWRNLISQAFFQVAALLTLQFCGRSIFRVPDKVKTSMIFNTFAFCQVFNEFNVRDLEKKNIFEGIHKDKLHLVITGINIFLQMKMVSFLNKFADTEKLNWGQWTACMGIASLSLPIGFLFKCIPVPDHLDIRKALLWCFESAH